MNSIKFKGLAFGEHHFDFHVGRDLFLANDYSEIEDCDVDVDVLLILHERMLELEMIFKGNIICLCDRCLDPVTLPVDCEEKLIVNISHQNKKEDSYWEISDNEYQLDLSELFYETIALQRPITVRHDLKDCSPKIVELLTNQPNTDDKEDEIDPRWAKLKDFKE
jgi:uncharacterized metal-binding protein YceD (DUF177 family)